MIDASRESPDVKIPVSVLTMMIIIIIHAVSSPASVSVKLSSSHALSGSTSNSIPTPTFTSALSLFLSKTTYLKGSSNVSNDTPLSKIDSTVVNSGSSTISSNNDNVAVISEGSSVLNHGGESAVSMETSSSSSIALAAETSGASVSTSIRIFSIAGNSETHPGLSTASAIAMLTTQVVIASQTILMPSSAVSKLVVAGTTLAATGPAATIGDQVVFLQSGALVVGTSTISFMGAEETVTVGDVVHSLPNNGALLVAETTIKSGASAVTIAETAVSLSFSNLVIEFSTIALASSPLDVIHTTSTAPITPYPSEVVTLNHTITQGSPAITISGTAISLGSTGLMIGSKISFLPSSSLDVVHTTSSQPIIP